MLLHFSRVFRMFYSAVGNSPLFWDESPFRRIRQMFEPHFVVLKIDEFSEMEIRPKIGVSCRRLVVLRFSCMSPWCFCICKKFASGNTSTHAWDDNTAMRCVAIGWLSEHWIPDFISFTRARNPVFWPKMGIENRGFRALVGWVMMRLYL
jgi:hypothetical protein